VVILCWLFYAPVIWVVRQFIIDPFSSVLIVLLPVAWILRPKASLHFNPFRFSAIPSILFWFFLVLYLLNENYIGVHIFSAALCIATMFSFMGFFMPRCQWHDLLLPFSTVVLLLPFGGYLDVYLGFPLRLACAEWAGGILQQLGFTSVTNESIILIEEKAANVNLDCSGVKGLWAGAIFYLLLSKIEGHTVSWRWLLIGAGFIGCLLAGNVIRIVTLVIVGLIGGFAQLADLIHMGMGLLGFSISCLMAWVALRLSRSEEPPAELVKSLSAYSLTPVTLPHWQLFGFIAALIAAVWLHQPIQATEMGVTEVIALPAEYQPSDIKLSPLEQEFFTSNQALVTKHRFNVDGIEGSVLIVNSRYWKAQHEPHNCYIGQGFQLGMEGDWLLSNGNAVRFLQVNKGAKTAVYWFQLEGKVTPNYSARVLNGVTHPKNSWLMVSILFDEPTTQKRVNDILVTLQTTFSEQLIKGAING